MQDIFKASGFVISAVVMFLNLNLLVATVKHVKNGKTFAGFYYKWESFQTFTR